MAFLKRYWGLLLVVLLSSFSVLPFFNSGFFPIHDDTQVARVYEMGKSLKDGMFPVRWVADLGYGYGYPIFNFYAPLTYYVGGFFNTLGFDALVSTKATMVLGIVLSGVFMYLLAREFWGELGGIISGLFYLYAPYHAVDIYVRGDVSEFWAYAFIPLIFLAFYKLHEPRKVWRWIVVGSLSFAGLILSHNLTALMVTPFLIILLLTFVFVSNRNLSALRYALYAFFLGLLISAFYYLPALLEMSYTNILSQIGGGADFSDHFVCPIQLWDSVWGFGGSIPGCLDGMSFKIGKLHIVFSILSFFLLIALWKKGKRKSVITLFALAVFSLTVFLTLEQSRIIWETLGVMSFFQYPWRFLILISFSSSFLAGYIVWVLENYFLNKQKYLRFVVIASVLFLLTFFNYKLFGPQEIIPKTASDYTRDFNLKWTTSKISDEYMPKAFSKPYNPQEIPKNSLKVETGAGQVKLIEAKTGLIKAETIFAKDSLLKINIAYFPAWKVYIDNNESSFEIVNDGLLVPVSSGNHIVDIKFKQTTVEKYSDIISLTGVFMLILGIILSRKK